LPGGLGEVRKGGASRLERRTPRNPSRIPGAVISRIALLSACFLIAANAQADIKLPRLVGDNMVLQRDMPIRVWGWADPGEDVQLRFRNRVVSTRADDSGRWSATLTACSAGGPAAMRIAGKNVITVKNILVGDVWLASGQSNMQFPLARDGDFGGVADAEQEIDTAHFPQIRLFAVTHVTALQPLDDVTSNGWVAATRETVRKFSAVAYLFGREIHQRYRVPIGLIESAWGGTPAETWVSAKSLKKFPEFDASLERQSRIGAAAIADFGAYLAARNRWYELHGREDRGSGIGDGWAAADYEDADWPLVKEPQPWPIKPVKGFDGTVWYRKEIDVLPDEGGKPVHLHLSHMLQADTTYFNGARVGETTGEVKVRDYSVPALLVKAGRNIVTVRLAGQYDSGDGYVGMLGEASQMYADFGSRKLSLAGFWHYQPGPDLSGLPEPPPIAEFRGKFPSSPALLFNSMIAPLVPYGIKGVIWYQGESNVGRAVQYQSLFPALINDWRTQWGYQFPFLFVQLAGFEADSTEPAESERAELREAQTAALSLAATGMASAIDIGDRSDVHPKNKQDVAHRLALAATKVAYGENVVYSGPVYRSIHLEPGRIRLEFSSTGSGLRVRGREHELRGFAVAASGGPFVWARALLDGNDVIVSSEAVPNPAMVRYDWGNTPDGNLYNAEGLPALPFRTHP
jgi:sialate O-acetylesterase